MLEGVAVVANIFCDAPQTCIFLHFFLVLLFPFGLHCWSLRTNLKKKQQAALNITYAYKRTLWALLPNGSIKRIQRTRVTVSHLANWNPSCVKCETWRELYCTWSLVNYFKKEKNEKKKIPPDFLNAPVWCHESNSVSRNWTLCCWGSRSGYWLSYYVPMRCKWTRACLTPCAMSGKELLNVAISVHAAAVGKYQN